jgi:hypothetical protein
MEQDMDDSELDEIEARYKATREPDANRHDRHDCMCDVPDLVAEVRRLKAAIHVLKYPPLREGDNDW